MRKKMFIAFSFVAGFLSAQNTDLLASSDVSVTIAGLSEGNTISKSKLVKAKHLDLAGAKAKNFSIVSYVAVYTGKDGLTEEEMEGPDFSIDMNNFFHIIEKNSRLSFKEIILKNTEGGKLSKVAPLNVIVHTTE
jgi:hypothetical protein